MHDDGCKVICKRHGECVRKLEENIKRKRAFLRNKYIDEEDYDKWCICRRSSYFEHHITLFLIFFFLFLILNFLSKFGINLIIN